VQAPWDPAWSCMNLCLSCSANRFCGNLNSVTLDPLSWFPSTMRLESMISCSSPSCPTYWLVTGLNSFYLILATTESQCYVALCYLAWMLFITQFIKLGAQEAVYGLEQDVWMSIRTTYKAILLPPMILSTLRVICWMTINWRVELPHFYDL